MELDPAKCQGIIAPEGTPLMFQCNMPPTVRTPKGLYCDHHQPKGTARMSTTAITNEIATERLRQQTGEGWTTEHDDQHDAGELAAAGAAYAVNAADQLYPHSQGDGNNEQPIMWPWSGDWWKPTTPRRDLIKAAALIVAEIERIDRLANAS